ncbi:Purine and uridine phosphorylase [Mycena sanguinolenta]|uniref:Purine and uridine phosphorylase n=1 Tax=Mycena sanguinolenta TaxID=230812 RepID=A0A8H6ZL13_9AGAR|nr:Purine and uridine phosphorylase [Mycena sanguinolenta]
MSSGLNIGSLTQNIHGGRGGAGGTSSNGAGGTGGIGQGSQFRFDRVENVFMNDQDPFLRTPIKLQSWLKPPDVSHNQRAAEDRHHIGTGKWFERTQEFKKWESTSPSLLWLHGISGCGKTILSSTVIKKFRDNGNTIAYFYFDTADDQKQKLEDLLRSLISRLADSASHAASILERFWKSHASGAEAPSNQTLLEILIKILFGFTASVYIVCDALDESSEVGLVLDALSKIMDANINNVHVFLTSRTEVTHGKELFSLAITVCLKGTGVNNDIASYVDHILATDRDFSWSKEMKDDVRNSLVNQPDPMSVHIIPSDTPS